MKMCGNEKGCSFEVVLAVFEPRLRLGHEKDALFGLDTQITIVDSKMDNCKSK
jgi:hypothetical protein